MQRKEGRAPVQEKPGPAQLEGNVYPYHRCAPKSTFGSVARTILVCLTFAAWGAAIVGAYAIIVYGTLRGIAAMSDLDPETLRTIGLWLIGGFVASCVLISWRCP